MAGYLAHQVRTFAEAKKLYEIETEGLAGFSCGAGLMNGRTSAREQEKLRQEMLHNQPPLVLTELLREVMNLPSPPPVSPGSPPPEL